jgi:nucleotide-binding universal stress UspA family protein
MNDVSLNFENVKKILIPTDGSDYSIRAAEYGVSIAKMLDAQILVVYVIDIVGLQQIFRIAERENAEKELKETGQRYINYVLGLAEKAGVKATSFLAKGRPFEQIVHIAKELTIDLIIMGTYGRRGTERILIGSVAERVIEYSPCPVLVVK